MIYGGDDAGIINRPAGLKPDIVLIYNPVNDLVPSRRMTPEKLESCIPSDKTRLYRIPRALIREIEVNKIPVWRNSDYFGFENLGPDAFDQSYYGRGKIHIRLRDDMKGAEDLAKNLIKRDLGFLHL